MIDLNQARDALKDLAEDAEIPVTMRWMKRAIREIEAGRAALAERPAPLDHAGVVVGSLCVKIHTCVTSCKRALP